jgi:PhnB protein
MQLNPYLLFNGQCEAAFKLYEQCLGGKIEMMQTHGDSPMAAEVPPEWSSRIMHARMTVGDYVLMGSDTPPEHFETPQGFSLALHFDDPAEAERVFNALAENGTVKMPLQQTFWAFRFGMLTDQFGVHWMVNCEKAAP